MTSDLLIEHFDRISDATNAIPRLRRFVFNLAVRGKLVEQDPKDEAADGLLRNIKAEKASMLKSGSTIRKKPVPLLAEKDLPFHIPRSWRWSQLAEVGFINPRNVADDGLQASFVPMPHIATEYGVASTHEIRTWREIKTGFTHFADGDAVLAKITPCFENCKSTVFRGLTGGIGAGTTELHVVRPVIVSADYVLIFLKCPHFIASGISKMTGTAGQKRVPTEYFAQSPFPLPPLSEQLRIVAKVKELMALCNRLELAQGILEKERHKLVAASHHHLNNGVDQDISRGHARFFLDHLQRLAARPEQVLLLRETVLNLAVRGQLIPQDRSDELASELLRRICMERQRRIKNGIITQRKSASPSNSTELVFRHPTSWEAVNFGRLCNMVTSGSRGWAEYYSKSGPKFIRAQNIRFGKLLLENLACVNPPKNGEGTRTQVSKGDILVVITGAGVTNPALLDRELGEAYVSQHVALIKPTDASLSPWLLLCLMAPMGGRAELVARAYGAGKPGLNLDNIRSLPIPLPPFAEQQRIIAKVNALLELCDELDARITSKQENAQRLLNALLDEALSGTASEEIPKLTNGKRAL